MTFSAVNRANTINGIVFIFLFALSSFYLTQIPWLNKINLSPLIIAIALGMIYGNTLRHALPNQWLAGIHFSSKRLLRLAIILYGFKINLQQIYSIGSGVVLLDFFIVISTLSLGYWVGVKVLKLQPRLALLISSGSAICGAAAILAVEDTIKSESYQTSIAIATVVLFGTLSMVLFPLLQHANMLHLTDNQFGVFIGASIHEVAQALAAGANISDATGNIAVIVKMTRVLLLAPLLIMLSICKTKTATPQSQIKNKLMIPWFAIGFVAVVGINSLHLIPLSVVNFINQVDIFLLTMSMAAVGIETHLNKIKQVGAKPLYLASILFIWLIGIVYLLIKIMGIF